LEFAWRPAIVSRTLRERRRAAASVSFSLSTREARSDRFDPGSARESDMAINAISGISGKLELDSTSGMESAAASASTSTSAPSFGQTLAQVVSDAINTVQAGEAASIQGLQGNMAPFKVVEAVMDAQRTLQSTLAIRDKAVAAYQEVSRMTI
jgi:flagellar hook-basal body complex protein FliE